MAFQLRPYQLDAVEEIRKHIRASRRRVLCVAPTGAGKTVLAVHMIDCSVGLGNRILFLAHRRELITQAFKKVIGCSCRPGFDHDSLLPDPLCLGDGMPRKSVGVLMAKDRRRNPGAAVQVASVDTLRNRAKPPADLIIVDECFPAGTLVDGRDISTLRVGDSVTCVNHATGTRVRRAITKAFRSRPQSLVTVHFSDGQRLVCTPGHPLFTAHGYVAATNLLAGDIAVSACPKGARSEEGNLLGVSRVDRVEVHERGSDDQFGGLCPDGHVYNIEVDEHHNYFANGFLVHNCHRSLAKTYTAIVDAYPNAAIIGLTATPYRMDRRGLGEVYDEIVVVSSVRKLVAIGSLVASRVFTVPAASLPDLSRVRLKGNDYDPTQLNAAVDRKELVGNIVEHWKRLASDRITIVFAASVEHSKHIAEEFRAAGIAAEHLDGETETAERDAVLARLDRGEIRVVTNYGILTEGFDQPSVKCVVLARPTKSLGTYIQMAGRSLRPYLNLDALILDHAGCTLEHGFVEDDREFTLDAAPKKPKSVASGKTCPACYAIVPAAIRFCTACNHEFVVAERTAPTSTDGTLVEVRPATQDEKRTTWNEICATAIAKGYAKGWAGHRFKEKYGTWPPNSFVFPERPRVHVADAIKREFLDALREECAGRGYDVRWVHHKYRAKFGEDVPAAWLMPRIVNVEPLAMAVGDDVGESVVDDRIAWDVG